MAMNCDEFLSAIKSRGATMFAPANQGTIMLTNTSLQNMHCAMLPMFMIDLYQKTTAINLGNGYIFGPTEIARPHAYPIPSITDINQDFSGMQQIRNKTIFGRNDLFIFAFDAFGKTMMLDNLTLRTLREYDNPYRALTDCLIAGKI